MKHHNYNDKDALLVLFDDGMSAVAALFLLQIARQLITATSRIHLNIDQYTLHLNSLDHKILSNSCILDLVLG